MNKLLFLAAALIVLSSTMACAAWTGYSDGTALPTGPAWWEDNNGGAVSVAGGLITMSAPADGWYDYGASIDPGTIPTMVVGASFKVNSMGGGGLSLLLGSASSAEPTTPLGLAILGDGHFALVNYSGPSGSGSGGRNNPLVLQELGTPDGAWHTAYLLSAPGGAWQANVDGVLYSGTMDTQDWGDATGYAEFAASTYWMNTRAVNVSFDWFGYGDASNMVVPEPGSLIALGIGLTGLIGTIRRRR